MGSHQLVLWANHAIICLKLHPGRAMKHRLALSFYFTLSVLFTFVLASLFHSQFVLHELSRLGVEIDLATRLQSSLDDMLGLLPGYGVIIALSLLLGFGLINLVNKFFAIPSYWRYAIAGLLAMLTAHLAMFPIFNVTLVAGARTALGLACQCLAATAGGWIFAYCLQNYLSSPEA